jgi:hypothetical protein
MLGPPVGCVRMLRHGDACHVIGVVTWSDDCAVRLSLNESNFPCFWVACGGNWENGQNGRRGMFLYGRALIAAGKGWKWRRLSRRVGNLIDAALPAA